MSEKNMPDIETRARELLAAEYDKLGGGYGLIAQRLRNGDEFRDRSAGTIAIPLRAITRALSSGEGGEEDAAYVRRLERAVIELSEGDLNDRDGVSAETEILEETLAAHRGEIMR